MLTLHPPPSCVSTDLNMTQLLFCFLCLALATTISCSPLVYSPVALQQPLQRPKLSSSVLDPILRTLDSIYKHTRESEPPQTTVGLQLQCSSSPSSDPLYFELPLGEKVLLGMLDGLDEVYAEVDGTSRGFPDATTSSWACSDCEHDDENRQCWK